MVVAAHNTTTTYVLSNPWTPASDGEGAVGEGEGGEDGAPTAILYFAGLGWEWDETKHLLLLLLNYNIISRAFFSWIARASQTCKYIHVAGRCSVVGGRQREWERHGFESKTPTRRQPTNLP